MSEKLLVEAIRIWQREPFFI